MMSLVIARHPREDQGHPNRDFLQAAGLVARKGDAHLDIIDHVHVSGLRHRFFGIHRSRTIFWGQGLRLLCRCVILMLISHSLALHQKLIFAIVCFRHQLRGAGI
jgi:hypothetical protein